MIRTTTKSGSGHATAPSSRWTTLALVSSLASVALPVAAQTPLRTLTLDDYPRWSRVTDVQLSADGRWATYGYAPNEGEATLHVRELDGPALHEIERGSGPAFSDDSRWVAYFVNPPGSGGGRGGRAGGGGQRGQQPGGRGQGGGAANGERTLEIFDLQRGLRATVPDVQSFRFSPDSRFIAIEKRPAGNGASHVGRDLIIRELANGMSRNIGNVSAFAFNEPGTLLAYVVDAADRVGNGVYLLDPASGAVNPLDTDTLHYDRLTWNDEGTALAVLRGETPAGREHRVNTLVAFTGLTGANAAVSTSGNGNGNGGTHTSLSGSTIAVVYDPSADPAFPRGMVLSELGSVSWGEDGSRIFVGIKAQRDSVHDGSADEPAANVEVWHWADERLQSVQKVQANADQRSTFAGVVHLRERRFVQLADEGMPRVTTTRDGRWAVGDRDAPYRMLFDEAGGLGDVVRINADTGERTTLVERIRFQLGTSPDGRWHTWFSNGTLWAQDIATGERTDLSAMAGVDFTNRNADRPGEKNAYGLAGWSKDGNSVLVNHAFDIWSIPLTGVGAAVNLTGGVGEREQIRFRIIRLDDDDDDPGIDTSQPIVLSAYAEWTKMSGYWTVGPTGEPRPVIWQDRAIGGIRKAKNADRVLFTAQTFEEFPDWWMSNTRFANPVRITDANPQQKEYRWGKRVLVDYTDARGNKLQATLTLPAGYEPGRRYPMLVYFYERLSQNHHSYSMPTYDDRPHMSTYASDGYLVLMPDIVYDEGLPGSSALDDVTSAVRKVIELGYADPARIGAQGHSWGGYESSFIVTQTDMFAAVVTGAPLTNLESMHNILYKSSGGGNAPLIQWGQGRMGTVPWDDPEGYASQSPVRFVKNINTPFMILHGTADGAVDWNQGLEFYVAARREGKKVILLSYPDEPHHLGREENQKDFQVRMKQFFDHYLKDVPAPSWMTEGLPYLDRAREERPGR